MEAEDGEVSFRQRHPYDSRVLHSFGNVPRKREVLQGGKVHVDVGFLDLAGLAAAVEVWHEGEEGGCLGCGAAGACLTCCCCCCRCWSARRIIWPLYSMAC